jgi:hypothetical protein
LNGGISARGPGEAPMPPGCIFDMGECLTGSLGMAGGGGGGGGEGGGGGAGEERFNCFCYSRLGDTPGEVCGSSRGVEGKSAVLNGIAQATFLFGIAISRPSAANHHFTLV